MATIPAVKPPPERRFLTLREAAEWYEVSEATLWRLLADGRLTRMRREGDKRTYLKVEELEERLQPRPVEGEESEPNEPGGQEPRDPPP